MYRTSSNSKINSTSPHLFQIPRPIYLFLYKTFIDIITPLWHNVFGGELKMGKVRTQVQLEKEEYEWLKTEAYRRRSSISSILREAIDSISGIKKTRSGIDITKAMAFVGRKNCGKRDVSIHHDDYLAGVKK